MTILFLALTLLVSGRGQISTATEGSILFLPPAFRFLKYCKPTEVRCIEQNTLELWSDLKRYSDWKRKYPASSLWWTTTHPKMSEWLESQYLKLRVHFVDES